MLLLGRAAPSPLPEAVTMIDVYAIDYDELLLLGEVHRLAAKAADLAGGPVPTVGSPQWWDADPMARIAGLLVVAERHLLADPERIAAEQLKAASMAISRGMDWRKFADHHLAHTELQRRRAELGPLWKPYAGGPAKWETASSQEAAA